MHKSFKNHKSKPHTAISFEDHTSIQIWNKFKKLFAASIHLIKHFIMLNLITKRKKQQNQPSGATHLIFCVASLMSQVLQCIQFEALICKRILLGSVSFGTNSYTPANLSGKSNLFQIKKENASRHKQAKI